MSYLTKFGLTAVTNNKGGVGKTTLAQAIANKLMIDEHPPSVIQIDRQHRLALTLGGDVLTIDSDPKASRSDPQLEIRRFNPILDRIEKLHAQQPILIDIGAGEVDRFTHWAALVDLEEELEAWQLPFTVLIPFLAEAEAIRQAAWTAERITAALPQARIFLVENRRDGRIDQLHPSSAAATAVIEQLQPWQRQCASLTMPAIPGGSWRWFEAANCRFIDVVDMSTQEVMAITGLQRAEAKIVRGDVSQWLLSMLDEFDRVLGGV